jgi:murein DD-endopeptidase MepM/ murein hydrolase activator NlpD
VVAGAAAIFALGCGSADRSTSGGESAAPAARPESPIPDPTGWGPQVLSLAVRPDGAVWVGTYGDGIYVSRSGRGDDWEHMVEADSGSISWNFVNAFAFGPGTAWYGTVGNGWGLSRDDGASWENWTFSRLGPRWQYVVPAGIATAGDTVYVATADGLRITSDGAATWREVTEASGLPNKYLLALSVRSREGGPPVVRVAHLRGISESEDGGRTWRTVESLGGEATRTLLASGEAALPSYGGIDRRECAKSDLAGRICAWTNVYRDYPDPGGEVVGPSDRAHFRFRRPVGPEDNPHLDQTYTYGSTMGGNFQQHQGVEFNVPEGTPILAAADGIVAFAGPAEAGALTVVLKHDEPIEGQTVWTAYYHNSALKVERGEQVAAGDTLALAGNTGRATNDHLHFEVHTTPADADVSAVVDPEVRYPPWSRNPQLWLDPLPGTGVIAGRVLDADGTPVPGVRVYGVTKPEPVETPFSFAETYEDRAHPDPVFGENFAIGDVPAGDWVLGAEVDGRRIWRKVRVAPGRVTEVELRP